MIQYQAFLINCLSNTHMGSGDAHLGVVDNLIQRDPVTQFPVFHSSGVKGALRYHLKALDDGLKNWLFGTEGTPKNNYPGNLIIHEANLLLLPLRATHKVYYLATCPKILHEYFESLELFLGKEINFKPFMDIAGKINGIPDADFGIFESIQDIEIEDFTSSKNLSEGVDDETRVKIAKFIKTYLQTGITQLAIFKDTYFSEICNDCLPVLARNQINDETGISENLFYEEVLPRRSKLCLFLGIDETTKAVENLPVDSAIKGETTPELFKSLAGFLTGSTEIVQFGGNYSIGYGFSRLSKIE